MRACARALAEHPRQASDAARRPPWPTGVRKLTTTILIADDHVVFRQGLARLLREQDDCDVVAEADDGAEAVRLAALLRPHIALLDIEMPRMSGFEAARGIRDVSPESRIVVLSMYADAPHRERARQAGASGYALKSQPLFMLLDIIDLVLRGADFVVTEADRVVSAAQRRGAAAGLDGLSAREREVLRMLAQGRRTQEIAASLGLGVKSVETYRRRVMEKLGIDNVAGLVRFAIRAGLVEADH